MVTVAAQACAEAMTDEELAKGMLYPAIERLRSVSAHVARNVATAAVDQGISNVHPDQIDASLADDLWDPHYPELSIE